MKIVFKVRDNTDPKIRKDIVEGFIHIKEIDSDIFSVEASEQKHADTLFRFLKRQPCIEFVEKRP